MDQSSESQLFDPASATMILGSSLKRRIGTSETFSQVAKGSTSNTST